MAKQDGKTVEQDLPFPVEGVDDQRAYSRQRQGTTPDSMNVRAFEPLTDRARGGARAGLEKVYTKNNDGTAVTNKPIQDINQLSQAAGTTTVTVTTGGSAGTQQFTYAQVAGSGFSIANAYNAALIATPASAVIAGYSFACSCWDDFGYCYVAMLNTTTGDLWFFKTDSLGTVVQAQQYGGAVFVGALRNFAGMTWCGSTPTPYLFFAVKPQAGTAYIWRLSAATLIKTDGATPYAAYNATLGHLTFSTNSHNCLAMAGGVLGVASAGSGVNQGFRTFDPNVADPLGGLVNMLGFVGWGGTLSQEPTRVCSDGTNFYVLADVTTNKLKKVSSGRVILAQSTTAYQTAALGSPTAMDISASDACLLLGSTVAPFIRKVLLTDLSTPVTASPGSAAQWDEIASDGHGTFMLYRNAAANNFMTVNTSGVQVLAMSSALPNATQYGASANKGSGVIVPVPSTTTTTTTNNPAILISLLVKGGEVMPFDANGPRSIIGGPSFNGVNPDIFSSQNGPNLFYVDGSVYRYYKGTTTAMVAWTPTAGAGVLPTDALGNPARLICTWRGRTVLAIGRSYFMSKQFDPFDWNYAPQTVTQQTAFAGNADLAGYLGDLITCLIPFDDDVMWFGCDHSIYELQGDPMAGGKMNRIADGLGILYGRPFCFDTQSILYFFGSDCVVYKTTSGSFPQPISGQIRRRLKNINLATNRVRMVWDQALEGLHVWISPLDRTKATTHYFWEQRTEAWQPEQFVNPDHNPIATYSFDGDLPQDRQIYLGGRDGYVRRVNVDGGSDDGFPISSWVILGPIKTSQWDAIKLMSLQPTLSEGTGSVRYDVYWGKHAEEALAKALAGPSTIFGTWGPGRGHVHPIGREGFAIYVKLSSTNHWSIERLNMVYKTLGLVRKRS